MTIKSIILSIAAAACIAGCGPSKEEIAKKNAAVASIRNSLANTRQCITEYLTFKRYADGTLPPDMVPIEVLGSKIDRELSKPADISQLPKLEELVNEASGVQPAFQAEIDKVADELRKANEATRKAAEEVRKFDAEHPPINY